MNLEQDLSHWPTLLPKAWLQEPPWRIVGDLSERLEALLILPGPDWILEGMLLRHRSAALHASAVLEGPVILCPGASVAVHACLRGGVFLDEGVRIGPSCEIKSTLVLRNSAIAHLNYVGNSLVGPRSTSRQARCWPIISMSGPTNGSWSWSINASTKPARSSSAPSWAIGAALVRMQSRPRAPGCLGAP